MILSFGGIFLQRMNGVQLNIGKNLGLVFGVVAWGVHYKRAEFNAQIGLACSPSLAVFLLLDLGNLYGVRTGFWL